MPPRFIGALPPSTQVHNKVAGLAAAAQGFHDIHLEGTAEGRFENRLVRRARTLAMDIVGLGGTIISRRTIASVRDLSIANVD